ncbi:MAG: RusA family crossover junction endodeoxyribonuclease [Roseiflexaceae bacterium]|nr:RusA family crossover junction endodeoxyribonuclease [Roseiflexaceae bacterium]
MLYYCVLAHSFAVGHAVNYTLTLTLPMPPGVNNQYVSLGARRVLSQEARRYKSTVTRLLKRARDSGAISDDLCAAAQVGYLALFIDFYFETPLRRDLDGGLKIAQDTICAALGVNDNRVVDIHLVKRIDPGNPRIEVELEVLDEWQFEREREVLVKAKG